MIFRKTYCKRVVALGEPMTTGKFVWMNGEFVEWEKATVHVLTHALHYGTGVYEGIRCYNTDYGPGIFRPREHYERLLSGAKTIRLKPEQSIDELVKVTKELIRLNGFRECYVRPIIFFSTGGRGLDISNIKTDIAIATWEWGAYLGEEGLRNGIKCKIANVKRINRQTMPAGTKVCGNYVNSVLGKIEAKESGFDESILLTIDNKVAECTGENIFIVKKGNISTPDIDSDIVPGITRKSVIEICQNNGLKIEEREVDAKELFEADEIFLTGTAAEVTPVRIVDSSEISKTIGPITKQLQGEFFAIVRGKREKYLHWLELVDK